MTLEHTLNPTTKSTSQHIILSSVRTSFKQYRMKAALAAFLILALSIVAAVNESAAIASYTSTTGAAFVSYNIWELLHVDNFDTEHIIQDCQVAVLSSYIAELASTDTSYNTLSYHGLPSYNGSSKKKSRGRHWVEKRGGDGLAVACYVRVSSSHQANEGFSVDAQIEKLRKMIEKYSPSEIHWFIDPGMTGTRFDNRAVVDIMELRKQGKIAELWVSEIDRIGRDAPKLIMFFFNFCEDGGKIRTPETVYDNSHDLGAFIVLTVKAFAAQDSNQARSKASVAGKAESFRQKNWNKRVPLAYAKIGQWIQKIPAWEPAIKDIFALFIVSHNEAKVAEEIDKKYGNILDIALKSAHVKGILTDPVYVGRPEHLGVVVQDSTLAFIDEEKFRKCQDTINSQKQIQQSKPLDALEEMLAIEHTWALRFIEKDIVFVHRGCGGAVEKNGAFKYNEVRQQLFRCRKCKVQWRVPSMSQLDQEKGKLIDDARDLLQDAIDKKRREKVLAKQKKDEQYGLRPASFDDLFWFSDQPSAPKDPDFGVLFGWLFR